MTRVNLNAHRRSVTMNVDRADHIGRVIAASGRFYEQDLLENAYHRLRGRPGLVVDAGAHIGNHTLWFSQVCRRHVIAVEPDPASAEQLRQHVRLNDADVDMYRLALGAEDGHGHLIEGPVGNTGMTRVALAEDGDVPVVGLDALMVAADPLGTERIALLKIDVEDAAEAVIAGGAARIGADRPLVYAEGEQAPLAAALNAIVPGWVCFGEFAKTPTFGFEWRGDHGTGRD